MTNEKKARYGVAALVVIVGLLFSLLALGFAVFAKAYTELKNEPVNTPGYTPPPPKTLLYTVPDKPLSHFPDGTLLVEDSDRGKDWVLVTRAMSGDPEAYVPTPSDMFGNELPDCGHYQMDVGIPASYDIPAIELPTSFTFTIEIPLEVLEQWKAEQEAIEQQKWHNRFRRWVAERWPG